MWLTLNGKRIEIDQGMDLSGFINLKGLEPDRIVVEYNFDIARREDWSKIILKENDNLEVLRFVGGG